MVALYNGVGGGAAALISWSEFRHVIGRRLEHPARRLRPDPVLDRDRLGLLLGIEHRLRQAPGDHPEPAGPVPGPAHLQRAAAGRDPGRLHRARHRPRLAVAGPLHRRADRRGGAGQPLRAADRRRRHAGGDLAAQRLHRARRRRGRVRPRQRRPDRRRHAGRLLGNHPHARDEPGDEPLDRQPALLRLRRRQRRRRGRGRSARSTRSAPRTRRSSSATPTRSSSSPATAWRWRRPSTRSRSSPTSSRSAGWRSATRSTRRRADARPHERAARRGRRPLRAAQGDGRDQPRDAAHRRRGGDRRERRHQPRREGRPRLADRRACRSSRSTRPAR